MCVSIIVMKVHITLHIKNFNILRYIFYIEWYFQMVYEQNLISFWEHEIKNANSLWVKAHNEWIVIGL